MTKAESVNEAKKHFGPVYKGVECWEYQFAASEHAHLHKRKFETRKEANAHRRHAIEAVAASYRAWHHD